MGRKYPFSEFLTQEERERLDNLRGLHEYLGTTVGPERRGDEVISLDDMQPIEVNIIRDADGPKD